jgi:hypothetical protein
MARLKINTNQVAEFKRMSAGRCELLPSFDLFVAGTQLLGATCINLGVRAFVVAFFGYLAHFCVKD